MILQMALAEVFFIFSGNSSKEGAGGSPGQAMGAGEDRGGEKRGRGEAKEV